jgi:hypothetical protein
MPLKNVKFIPAVCSKCGANLQLPEGLTKAYCIYCGAEFIISEQKGDIHYHLGEKIGSIENYIDLAISSINAGDMVAGKKHMEQAKEINLNGAENLIKKKAKEITLAYFNCIEYENKKILSQPPVMNYSQSNYLSGTTFAIMKSTIETISLNAKIAVENAYAFVKISDVSEEEKNQLNEYFYLLYGEYCLGMAHLWIYEKSVHDAWKNEDARSNFRKVLQYNPNNQKAINNLKQIKDFCSNCNGEGFCKECNGSGVCSSCGGQRTCSKCLGSGFTKGIFGKEKQCNNCQGDGTCRKCSGNGICSHCQGKKKCSVCNGIGIKI